MSKLFNRFTEKMFESTKEKGKFTDKNYGLFIEDLSVSIPKIYNIIDKECTFNSLLLSSLFKVELYGDYRRLSFSATEIGDLVYYISTSRTIDELEDKISNCFIKDHSFKRLSKLNSNKKMYEKYRGDYEYIFSCVNDIRKSKQISVQYKNKDTVSYKMKLTKKYLSYEYMLHDLACTYLNMIGLEEYICMPYKEIEEIRDNNDNVIFSSSNK